MVYADLYCDTVKFLCRLYIAVKFFV